jgi:hypothetical protein
MLGLPKRKSISAVVTSCDQKARESAHTRRRGITIRDAIFGFFGQVHQETAGTLRANVLSMAATGDQVFVRSEVTGQRLGNSLNADHVQIFTIADGQVTGVLVYSADHSAEAAFWS